MPSTPPPVASERTSSNPGTVRPATTPVGGVPTTDPATLSHWLRDGACVLVDVREPDENARERIREAWLEPLSKLDARRLAAVAANGTRLVMHCKSGRRSADAAAQVLSLSPPGSSIFSLAGGIEAWRAAALPTDVDSRVARMSIMRQVQLTIGVLVLVGCALAWFVHPAFIALPAFLGAGLTFAGASGTCGLALLLERMPWNRRPTTCSADRPAGSDRRP